MLTMIKRTHGTSQHLFMGLCSLQTTCAFVDPCPLMTVPIKTLELDDWKDCSETV